MSQLSLRDSLHIKLPHFCHCFMVTVLGKQGCGCGRNHGNGTQQVFCGMPPPPPRPSQGVLWHDAVEKVLMTIVDGTKANGNVDMPNCLLRSGDTTPLF